MLIKIIIRIYIGISSLFYRFDVDALVNGLMVYKNDYSVKTTNHNRHNISK